MYNEKHNNNNELPTYDLKVTAGQIRALMWALNQVLDDDNSSLMLKICPRLARYLTDVARSLAESYNEDGFNEAEKKEAEKDKQEADAAKKLIQTLQEAAKLVETMSALNKDNKDDNGEKNNGDK